MAESYAASFDQLCEQIKVYSPSAVHMLDHLKVQCGVQAAFYAAFVIVCVHENEGMMPTNPKKTDTSELQSFTFFEFVKADPTALAIFEDVLSCYRRERDSTRGGAEIA